MILRRTTLPLCLAFAFSLSAFLHAATPQVEVIAKTAKVKVREQTIAVVKKGETYRVLKTQGAWVAIAVGDGEKQKRGWILASAVKMVSDPAITEDTPAPAEPAEVRLTIDLTQFTPPYGAQTAVYFKASVSNEGVEPLDFKIADLELKVDDQPLPRISLNSGAYLGYQIFTDPTMRVQAQPSALPFLKDATIAPGAVIEGWLSFNLSSLQQVLFTPGALAGKTWIVEGKVGPHKIRIDLKAAELALIAEKPRPAKLDDSVQVIEIGPRINALNASKVLDLLRSIPAGDRGCVLVLKHQECSFDNLATMQFQQQMFQIINAGNQPVVSNEGGTPQVPGHPYQGFFSYGQIQTVASETAGVLTVLGRRADTGATLIKHLAAESSDTRAAAARALTQHLAEPGVVEALARVAADVESNVRTAAVGALGGQQPRAGLRQNGSLDTVALIDALKDSVPDVRMTAAQTAAVFLCDEVRAELIKLLDDMDIRVKLAAAGSLGTSQTRDAVPKLRELQSDANPDIKTVAIDALQKIGEFTPISAALAKLDGGRLQDADFVELGKARSDQAVPLLIARLKGNDNYQINLVGRTLGEIGDSRAVEPLIQIFVYGNRNFGMAELPRALGRLGDKRAVEPLRQALQVPNQNIQSDLRIAIFEALLQLKAPQAFEDVSGELEKIGKNNRHFEASPLLLALGRTRDAKAIPVVEPFLTNPQTCQAAADALCQLGTKAAFSALETRLSAADFPFSQLIIANRKWPRSAASVTLLKRLAGSANQQTSQAASQALANLQTNENSAPNAAVSAPIGYFAPVIAPVIAPPKAIEAWVNGAAPTPVELRGKVLLILMPQTTGGTPDLPAAASKWLQKFEKQGG
jgi:HEAT repeat protein